MKSNNMNNNDIKELELVKIKIKRERLFQRLIQTYIVFGIAISFFGMGYFIFLRYGLSITSDEKLSLFLVFAGVFISVFSFVFAYLRKQQLDSKLKANSYYTKAMEFIYSWSYFESRAKERLAEHDINFLSARDLINGLLSRGFISTSEMFLLEESLKLRNVIVHEGRDLPLNHLAQMIEKLNELNDKLKKVE